MSDNPNRFALIVGAMKSGTTTLFDLLAQHPQVAAARTKEPDFFVKHSDPLSAWDQYLALWDWVPAQHLVALEASVAYTKAPWIPDIPARIKRVGGAEFRFIYVLRHPLRRIESQIRHAVFAGWGKSLDEDGFTADLIDFSRYAMQIGLYREHFPAEHMLILTLEELEADPSAVLERCCRFLGLNEGFAFEGERERKNVGDLYTVPRWVRLVLQNDSLRSIAHALLPRAAYHRVRTVMGKRLGGREQIGRWRLNAQEEARVLGELAEDLRLLNSDYGIDTAVQWSIPARPDGERP